MELPYEKRNDLYKLLGKRDFDEALKQLERCPDEAQTWIVTRYGEGAKSEEYWKRLPLHMACERQPSETIVRALIESYPEALTAGDENGRVPLYHACIRKASVDVVGVLLESSGEQQQNPAECEDKDGRPSLHAACEYDAGADVVDQLLQCSPGGVRHVDSFGRIPLHWCCVSMKMSLETVRSLTKRYPEGVRVRDLDGKIPLNLAEDNITSPEIGDVVTELKAVEASLQADDDKETT